MRKPVYYYRQSGVIPFRIKDRKLEVLLITSRKKKKWIIPKGIIEPNLTPQESALKEAIEEAGISGKVGRNLFGEYKYDKWGGTCNVKVYLMEVHKQLDKWTEDFRDRKWVSVKKALDLVVHEGIRSLLKKVEEKL